MEAKPKQLRLDLGGEPIWEQLTEEARGQSLELLSRLVEELWKETGGESSDGNREDH